MNDLRANFFPILEAGGVDLILTGHSRVYERSHLLDGHYGKSDTRDPRFIKQAGGTGPFTKPRARAARSGEISVVTGSAGHAGAKPVPLYHPAMWISHNEAGSTLLDIDELKLDLAFLNEARVVRDRLTLLKR